MNHVVFQYKYQKLQVVFGSEYICKWILSEDITVTTCIYEIFLKNRSLLLFHSWYSDWNTTGNYLYLPKYFMNIMRCGVLCFCTTNDNIRNVIIINSIIYQFYVFEIFLGTIFPCYEWYHRDKMHQWAVFIIYLENSSFTCVKPIYLKIVAF